LCKPACNPRTVASQVYGVQWFRVSVKGILVLFVQVRILAG
jgi:hypothetical protein